MNKRRALGWLVIGLLTLAGTAVLVPKSPVYLPKIMGESGRYEHSARYWISDLKSPDVEVRMKATQSLGDMGLDGAEAVPVLAKVMREDPEWRVQNGAALALSKMAPASAAALHDLIAVLDGPDYWIRMNAVFALARLKSDARAAIPALIKATKEPTNRTNLGSFQNTIQQAAALALGRVSAGTAEGVPALTEGLAANDDHYTRVFFVRGLGEVGPEAKSAVPQLRQLLKHEDGWLRESAQEALQKITGESAVEGAAPPAPAKRERT
jgi:HEAT repeat protein